MVEKDNIKTVDTEYALKIELNKRWNSMRNEWFNGWNASALDLSTYIDQKRGWFDTRPNRGQMINHQILLDEHATLARDRAANGLMSGMTSQYRPWFRLTLDDITLDNTPGIREWLDETQRRMVEVINKSNLYSALHSCYEEIFQFGTGCFLILEDFEDVIRTRGFTAGEYYLSIDSKGRVNGFARYFWMTVGQLVKEFGFEQCSPQVQNQYRNNFPDVWVRINHLIEANETAIPMMDDFKNMPYRSAYWEFGQGTQTFLALRGYRKFPILAPRWKTTTTDQIYGYGPGWYSLGNIKQLQKTTFDKLLMQEKLHRPPMVEDASVEGHTNILPGGITKVNGAVPNSGVRPAFQVADSINSFAESIENLHQRIDRGFFVDLFQMLADIDIKGVTAEAIIQKKADQLMMIGPILYKLQEQLLDPAMELIFDIMTEANLVPPPPQQIAGANLKVKYVSILAQAQQSLGIDQIMKVIGIAGQMAQVFPDAPDNIDSDEVLRQVNQLEGAPSKIIREPEEIDQIRQQRQQQMNAQMALQAAEVAGKTTKNLATSPSGQADKPNVLEKMVPTRK